MSIFSPIRTVGVPRGKATSLVGNLGAHRRASVQNVPPAKRVKDTKADGRTATRNLPGPPRGSRTGLSNPDRGASARPAFKRLFAPSRVLQAASPRLAAVGGRPPFHGRAERVRGQLGGAPVGLRPLNLRLAQVAGRPGREAVGDYRRVKLAAQRAAGRNKKRIRLRLGLGGLDYARRLRHAPGWPHVFKGLFPVKRGGQAVALHRDAPASISHALAAVRASAVPRGTLEAAPFLTNATGVSASDAAAGIIRTNRDMVRGAARPAEDTRELERMGQDAETGGPSAAASLFTVAAIVAVVWMFTRQS